MVIDLDPASVGLTPATCGLVWGVVMDSVFPTGEWYCLAVLADGTTSIYTSGGYGVIGAGQHESSARRATRSERRRRRSSRSSVRPLAPGCLRQGWSPCEP
jgi:hypothetical protein